MEIIPQINNTKDSINHQPEPKKSVAIVGIAGIFPQAENIQQYWQNILEGVDCITDVPPSRWKIEDYYDSNPQTPDKTYCKRGGFMPDIEFNPLEFGLPPNILEVTDVAQLLSLVVAKQALADAGYENAHQSIRQKTGVVLGIGGGQKLISPLTSRLQYPIWEKVLRSSGLSEEDSQKIIAKIKLAYIPWEENSFPGMLGNVISGRVANRLDLGGMNCVVDAACASSLSALRMAISELTEYRSDMMITGGVDTDNTPFMYMCFSKTPAFSRQGEIRPFDAKAEGMLIGEALGMLVLKRLADAHRDGDRIYAVIKGMGTSSDGKYKSIYAPRASGQAVALRRAYEDAEVDPDTVGLIEAHGTGTMAGDPTEFAGLNEVFSENNPRQQYIALGSVKSQIGHTKSAAGVASLIKVALGLHHKILPPTINISQPNPTFNIEKSPFYLNTQTRPWLPINNEIPRRAGVSSFGFGGTNFHVVLEEYQQEQTQPYQLHKTIDSVLIHAPTPQKLLAKCQAIQEQLKSDSGEKYYQELIKDSQSLAISRLSARVGFVCQSLTETIKLLTIIINYLADNLNQDIWQHPQGIYYRKNGINAQAKVVALFSGQGSQYLEMGKELAINFPQMRQAFQLMDKTLVEDNLTPISQMVFPPPTFNKRQKDAQSLTLNLTENAQPAIAAFHMGLYNILQQAGFKADFVAGHSFGELTALWAAKVFSDEDYCFLVKSRGQAMASPLEANFDAGKMLAVKGDLEQIKSIVNQVQDVIIATYNSLEQVVLAGASSAILSIKEKLAELGFNSILLPVSAAFHSPLVSHAQTELQKAIAKIKFHTPQIPVFSNTTANLYPNNPEIIQQTLIDHIINPVYFKKQIENIYDAGGSIFIEFGAKNILTKLVQNILMDKPHVAVALNQTIKQDNLAQSISNKYFREAIIQLRVVGLNLSKIDIYQLEQKLPVRENIKDLTVTLNGANYVSEQTKNAFENALKHSGKIPSLNQSQKINTIKSLKQKDFNHENKNDTSSDKINNFSSQTTESKLPINNRLLTKDNSAQNKNSKSQSSIPLVNSFNKSLAQNTKSQATKINYNDKNMTDNNPKLESFERMMMRFYDHQAEVLKVHEQYLKTQSEFSQGFLELMQQQYTQLTPENIDCASVVSDKVSETQLMNPSRNEYPNSQPERENNPPQIINQNHDAINHRPRVDANFDDNLTTEITANQGIKAIALETLTQSLLQVVSEKTGYPTEMLNMDMDMETDLGIDSIKRVEILGVMQELYPDMPPVNPEELAELRTLVEIVDYMLIRNLSIEDEVSPRITEEKSLSQNDTQEIATEVIVNQSISATVSEDFSQSLLQVVSEKTGYPTQMLDMDMDMETDLGIDSIKRVEILGVMQELYPGMPSVNPEDLAELRTLAQIVAYISQQSPATEKKKLII